MPYDEPGKDFDGVRIDPRDVVGHLLLVWATDYIEHSPTRYTKAGDKSDVIVVDVVDLDINDPDTNQPGFLGQNVWWRQARLIQKLRPKVGGTDPLLVWMARGTATQGNTAPFTLESATADPKSVARADEWMARNGDFKPNMVGSSAPAQAPEQPVQAEVTRAEQPESLIARMARQAREGAARLPPPPPDPDDRPGF